MVLHQDNGFVVCSCFTQRNIQSPRNVHNIVDNFSCYAVFKLGHKWLIHTRMQLIIKCMDWMTEQRNILYLRLLSYCIIMGICCFDIINHFAFIASCCIQWFIKCCYMMDSNMNVVCINFTKHLYFCRNIWLVVCLFVSVD